MKNAYVDRSAGDDNIGYELNWHQSSKDAVQLALENHCTQDNRKQSHARFYARNLNNLDPKYCASLDIATGVVAETTEWLISLASTRPNIFV